MAKASANVKETAFGVHSEVGQLRKVMVCAPGLADFVTKMRDRGVEVLEMHLHAARVGLLRGGGAGCGCGCCCAQFRRDRGLDACSHLP
jgi:hypothetical protein